MTTSFLGLRTLVVGELVEVAGTAYLVGLVNQSRARLDVVDAQGSAIEADAGNFSNSINVGPTSVLRRLTLAQLTGEINMEAESNVSAMPVEGEAPSRARKAKAAAPAVKVKTAKTVKAKAEPKEKTVRKCTCGCGGETTGYFVPGHDARFKSRLLKIERGEGTPDELLGKKVAAQYQWKKKGKGLIPTLNYKGEKHTGYDKAATAAA